MHTQRTHRPVPSKLSSATAQIPEWLSWVQYLCGLKYGMNLFVLNEFGASTREDWGLTAQAAAKSLVDNNDIDPSRWWVQLFVLM